MLKIAIECVGVPPDAGPSAAADIEQEFREHRPWWEAARCTCSDGRILLTATSDADDDGRALLDEFGDCLADHLRSHGAVHIRSVERI